MRKCCEDRRDSKDNRNASIHIEQVDNGFIVQSNSVRNGGGAGLQNVFQSMVELQTFIEDHFDHRDTEIVPDDIHVEFDNK